MNLIKSPSSHWYSHNDSVWQPHHYVEKAFSREIDGPKLRPTTLADARKLGLFPSVSAINGIVNAPGLNNYRETQAVLAALTLPRTMEDKKDYIWRAIHEADDAAGVARWCYNNPPVPAIGVDEFAEKVVQDMREQSEQAKSLGTAVHDAISEFLKTSKVTPATPQLAIPAIEWITSNVIKVNAVEQIVGSTEHGYAGTLDLDCEVKGIGPALIDWKTQTVKRNGNGPKPMFYNSWGKQLAAYREASDKDDHAILSVIIDKGNSGELFFHRWHNWCDLLHQFFASADIWRFENGYDPRQL